MYDLIIIGAGPAGLTSAIYALRGSLKTLVVESDNPGGKLTKTFKIENYPGFKEINGYKLANDFIEHAKKFDVEIYNGQVNKVNPKEDYFDVILDDDKVYQTKAVIVASGTKERELELENAKEYTGRGISYCAVCDGFFYRKKDVVVIGGGNSALEEALYLSSIVNKVTIIIRRDEFRAEKGIVEEVLNKDNIEVIKNVIPYKLQIEDDKITGLIVKNVNDNTTTKIDCAGIFPYIGASPNTSFLDDSLLDENGYLIVDKDMATKIKGIYGAGDVTNKNLRQIVTATNDGAIAANSVIKYLKIV